MTPEEKAIVDILNNSSLTVTSDGKPLTVITKEYSLIASEIVTKVKNFDNPPVIGNEALRVALLAFADHLNTYKGLESYRFDFMVVDYLESKQ